MLTQSHLKVLASGSPVSQYVAFSASIAASEFSSCSMCRFTPMDFILPIVLFIACKRPKGLFLAFNIGLVVFWTLVSVLGAIGSFRFIIEDSINYSVSSMLFTHGQVDYCMSTECAAAIGERLGALLLPCPA